MEIGNERWCRETTEDAVVAGRVEDRYELDKLVGVNV